MANIVDKVPSDGLVSCSRWVSINTKLLALWKPDTGHISLPKADCLGDDVTLLGI